MSRNNLRSAIEESSSELKNQQNMILSVFEGELPWVNIFLPGFWGYLHLYS